MMPMTAAQLNVIFSAQGAGQVKGDLEEVGRAVQDAEEVEAVRRELEKAGYPPTAATHRVTRQDVIDLSRATANINASLNGLDRRADRRR